MRVVVDIDGVLAEDSQGHHDYDTRRALSRGLELVRQLKAEGHTVILHTARWKEDEPTTRRWLARYEVDYDELVMGKPRADVYIDDRAFRWTGAARFSRLHTILRKPA